MNYILTLRTETNGVVKYDYHQCASLLDVGEILTSIERVLSKNATQERPTTRLPNSLLCLQYREASTVYTIDVKRV